MRVYRSDGFYKVIVEIDGWMYQLKPKNRLTTAFCWGKGGLCAGELAYAILADCCGRKMAEAYHSLFKWEVVAKLEKRWELQESYIHSWLKNAKKKNGRRWSIGFAV